MCGITGVIGKSKNTNLSFKIISLLFEKIEVRGKDASGFWGVSEGVALFHKEPTPPTEFVKKNEWLRIEQLNPSVLICHAREASKGVGPPQNNENNHPFVNEDLSIAAVHNGRISDAKYLQLKDNFTLKSECDSELFLKMFEGDSEIENYIEDRIEILKYIWNELFEESHMAVVIGERLPQENRLWIFRNEHRSLWMADLRRQLGQIFFVSTKEIWEEATQGLVEADNLIEFNTNEIHFFKIQNNDIKFDSFVI